MSKPDAPTPPNPYQTAAAQTGTNVATGVANAFLNNVNQRTPQGSTSYDVTGSYSWNDPSTGQTYNIPRFTSTQTYGFDPTEYQRQNPDVAASGMDPYTHYQQFGQREGRAATGELGLYNTGLQTKQNLANMGQQQSARVGSLLSTPFNPNAGAPTAGSASGILGAPQAKTSYDAGGQIQTEFGDAGDITRSYGAGDFSQDRQNVEDALMARINPQLAKERGNIEQRLADQGIRYGSQAYTSAMDDYNRQATDTRFGAIGQAGSEQQRMMDMAAQRAGFQNSAQQQAYDQAMGRGSFANQAQAQQNAQNASAAGFYNAGAGQQLAQQQSGFNAQNAARNQYMQEQYQQRNQPLNEIAALMSGSQVQQPNWLNSPTSQIATTDIGGLINQNFAQQQQNYQTATSSWNATMGGLLGLGAGMIKSDRRAKKNIDRIGSVFAATEDGERERLPVYEYEYRKGEGDGRRHVGPMAQDVERIDPGAVREIGGVKHIDTGKVMGSILRAA
jgi:hypothetical protein